MRPCGDRRSVMVVTWFLRDASMQKRWGAYLRDSTVIHGHENNNNYYIHSYKVVLTALSLILISCSINS